MRNFLKKVFSVDNFMATAFIFTIMWVFSNISLNLDILNPVQDMFGDFQVTDLVSSKIREEMPQDTNVVVVNIGALNRAQIAEQIRMINKCNPKVIGIDAFFNELIPEHPVGDSLLAKAFLETKNLVLVSKFHYNELLDDYDSLLTSHPNFMKHTMTGAANLLTEGETKFRTARKFAPYDTIHAGSLKGHCEPFFAVKLAEIYRPGSTASIQQRKKELESIIYRGNIYGDKVKFTVIGAQDLLDGYFDPEVLKNKIVLMGYLGKEFALDENIWDEDKFFTPLNQKYVGKAVPDMFGVIVHANIISMILYNHYTNESPPWAEGLLGLLLCFCSVVAFHFVLDWAPQLFDPITKLVQLILIIVLIFLEAQVYRRTFFKIDFGIALVAIALAPDLLEIYIHLIKRFITFLVEKTYIRNKKKELT
jgi:CHASE2 domain-containing sensor protein